MKRILALTAGLLLFAAPVAAQTEDFDTTVEALTARVVEAVEATADTSIWQAPYEALAGVHEAVTEGLAEVEGLTVPECLEAWRDTLRVGLILLAESVEVVVLAAGLPDDAANEAFGAYGPNGYVLLVEVAPLLRATADCPPEEDVT